MATDAPYRMDPDWVDAAERSTRLAEDEAGPREAAPARVMFLRSEVGFRHPSGQDDCCRGCAHFVSPHGCRTVAGYVRPEDWCEKFEARK